MDYSNIRLCTVAIIMKRSGSLNFCIDVCVLFAFVLNRIARAFFVGKKLYTRISDKERPLDKFDYQLGPAIYNSRITVHLIE